MKGLSSLVQVLESSQGCRAGSLMGALDNCTTPAGKRLLSQWLCRPLLHIPDICARQDAVQALTAPHCAEAVGAARKAFSGQPLAWQHQGKGSPFGTQDGRRFRQ